MDAPSTRTAYLFLFTTMLLWGGNAVAGKLAVGHVSPMLLNTLRWLFACMLLFPWARPELSAKWPIVRANAQLLLLLGAFGMGFFGLGLYGALIFTTAINVSIEQASMPLVVFAANFILFGMRLTVPQFAGFLLSIIGVALTVTHGDLVSLTSVSFNIGDAIMIGGVIAYGIYTVILRYRPALGWKPLMFALMFGGFLTSLPFALWEWQAGLTILPISTQGLAVVTYATLLPSLLSQALFVRAVEIIGANRAGLFINLVPIFGTLLSILILGEALFFYHVAALALVLGGIALAERSSRRIPAAS